AVPLDATEAVPGQPPVERRAGPRGHETRRRRSRRSMSLADISLRPDSGMSSVDAGEQASARQYGGPRECPGGRHAKRERDHLVIWSSGHLVFLRPICSDDEMIRQRNDPMTK